MFIEKRRERERRGERITRGEEKDFSPPRERKILVPTN